MAAPTLIGLSDPIENTNFDGYAHLTLTEDDLAAGVAAGDRLIAILHVGQTGFVDSPPGGIPDGFRLRTSVDNGPGGFLAVLSLLDTRYGAVTLPATFTVGHGVSQSSASLLVATVRDLEDPSSYAGQGDSWPNTTTSVPIGWSPATYDAHRGFAFASSYGFNAHTALSPANGFSTIHNGGTLQIAFQSWDDDDITITPPKWTRPSGGPPYGGVSITFDYTGSVQTWTVPAGVTTITVDCQGAQGRSGGGAHVGGNGGRVQATVPVVAGQSADIIVGQSPTSNAGGFGGGGSATFYNAGAGGGRSELKIGGVVLVVAGGGGGVSYYIYDGGHGGGLTGQAGAGPRPGGGGTQSAGGAGGSAGGGAGLAGQGGAAGHGGWTDGGAGGGGYYGGGGGSGTSPSNSQAGAGGGGSSYTDPSCTGVVHTQGYRTGSGQVTISW